MTIKVLHEMDLVPGPSWLHGREVGTIVNAFLKCSRVANFWRQVEIWIRWHKDKHAKISNVEKIFGVQANNLAVNVIMMAKKEVIYRKRQGMESQKLYI